MSMTDDEDNPFVYTDEERREIQRPEHTPIGHCHDCGDVAYIELDGLKLCFPCGYNRANW